MRNRLVLLILSLILGALTGCDGDGDTAVDQTDGETLRIVTSFLPVHLLTLEVAGGLPGVEVEVIIDPAAGDPHNYQLTPGDRLKLERADLVIINGLDLEAFLDDALVELGEDVVIIEAAAGIEPLPNRQGPATEEHHDHEDEHDHGAINPHVWTSPAAAVRMVQSIRNALSRELPDAAGTLRANAEELITELELVFDRMQRAVERGDNRRIVTNHDAFPYLARDLGLEVAAVINSNPGAPLSAGEIAELVERLNAEGAAAIFVEPQYPEDAGRAVAAETGLPVYTLDPCATGEAEPGYFLEVQERNAAALERALAPGEAD